MTPKAGIALTTRRLSPDLDGVAGLVSDDFWTADAEGSLHETSSVLTKSAV